MLSFCWLIICVGGSLLVAGRAGAKVSHLLKVSGEVLPRNQEAAWSFCLGGEVGQVPSVAFLKAAHSGEKSADL